MLRFRPGHVAACRRNAFVQCRKNPRLADRRGNAVAIHIGSKIRTDTREDDADLSLRQIAEQIAHGLRGGVIDIRDGAGVDDKPCLLYTSRCV